jgi:hypothetical protein
MQRLRGRIYFDDGAIGATDLTSDGRHISQADRKSWHLLTLGATGSVLACARFRHHSSSAVFCEDLGVSRTPLAYCDVWGRALRASVTQELTFARQAGFSFLEVGGWALAPELRFTGEALRSVLAIYALARLHGGALGIGTATDRNSSSSILRRLGGRPLMWDGVALPGYYDEKFQCGMEILRFDSRSPNPKYAAAVHDLRSEMAQVPIVCPDELDSCSEERKKTDERRAPDFPVFIPGKRNSVKTSPCFS